ncbi:MAG TPA: hypothetical protein VFZ52_13745 [Chryseolinea sp.]
MKNFRKMLGFTALCGLICLSACEKDDPKSEACENGTLVATVNGDQETGSSFNNTLVKASNAGTDGKRMDIRATDAEGRQLIISFTDLSTGTEGNGVSTDAYIPIDDVTTGTENTFLFTIIEGGISYPFTDGTLDITSCDANAKKVSGTFSFSDGEFEVTNGSFTNMCYTVLQ